MIGNKRCMPGWLKLFSRGSARSLMNQRCTRVMQVPLPAADITVYAWYRNALKVKIVYSGIVWCMIAWMT